MYFGSVADAFFRVFLSCKHGNGRQLIEFARRNLDAYDDWLDNVKKVRTKASSIPNLT